MTLIPSREEGFLIATGRHLFRFLGDGSPDPDFGTAGQLEFAAPSGLELEPRSILVDPSERIVVGGDGQKLHEAYEYSPFSSEPVVDRYLPNGSLDPGFAQAGVFASDFAYPPPTPTPKRVEPFPDYRYEHPQVSLTGLGFDRAGLLLEGSATLEQEGCGLASGIDLVEQSFTAEIDDAGQLEGSYGESGVLRGQVNHTRCVEGEVRGEGHSSPWPGFLGSPRHVRRIATASATDPLGRTVLLVRSLRFEHRRYLATWHLVRLTRRGRFDPTFGRGGVMTFPLPRMPFGYISAIRVGPDGSTTLIGTSSRRPAVPGTVLSRLLVGRVDPDGHLDRQFGHGGFSSTGFGKDLSFGEPLGYFEDPGERLVIWASVGGERGFVLARLNVGG